MNYIVYFPYYKTMIQKILAGWMVKYPMAGGAIETKLAANFRMALEEAADGEDVENTDKWIAFAESLTTWTPVDKFFVAKDEKLQFFYRPQYGRMVGIPRWRGVEVDAECYERKVVRVLEKTWFDEDDVAKDSLTEEEYKLLKEIVGETSYTSRLLFREEWR